MTLDFPTLLCLQLLSSVTSATVLMTARGPSAAPGIRDANLAMVCLACGFASLLLREQMPPWLAVLSANPMFWLAAVLVHRAVGAYVGRSQPARWPFALMSLGFAAFVVLVWRQGPFGLRALTSSTLVFTLTAASCFELARHDGLTREPARKITFSLLGLATLGLAARIVLLLPRWAEPVRPKVADLQLLLAHLPAMLLANGFGVAFLLMHHERTAARAIEAASTDALTGCANRRALELQVRVELAYAERKGRSCALVLADVDHFKRVNDSHGHAVGDALLMEVARVLRGSVRPGDMVARYGGEEFCVLLRDADATLATVAAERLCSAVRALHFEASGTALPVRASFGVAAASGVGPGAWESLFQRADAALYQAKQQGRDRVVTSA